MVRQAKARVREALPARLRVPAKYWHARLTGTLEPEMALLPALIARGQRAIDVGGNYGAYAYALARIGAEVEVFEPNPICLAALRGWARGQANVRIHPFAASDAGRMAELAIPIETDGTEHDAAGSLERIVGGPTRGHRVETRPLDSFGYRDTRLIKIDVEGHEQAVIAGAVATIADSVPALLIEIEQRHRAAPIAETFARVAALGYSGYFLYHGALAPLADFAIETHQPLEALGTAAYHNNFLFLAHARLAAGDYRDVLVR